MIKARLNPLIERVSCLLARVDIYGDVFERLAMLRRGRGLIRTLLPRKIAPDVRHSPLLFIHVPKNGGTSVKHALYRSDPGHVTVRYYELFCPELLRNAETLAIVRDPVGRFLSGFNFLMGGGGGDVRIQDTPLQRMQHIATIDQLLDFVEAAQADWLQVDTFLRPQHWYVTDQTGRIRIRHLWALDRSTDGLSAFLEMHGLPALPHKNRSRKVRHEVTEAQRLRIEALYAEDVLLYDWVCARGGHATDLAGRTLTVPSIADTRASIDPYPIPSR